MALDLIIALIQICKEALTAGRGLKSFADEKYTTEEQEILIDAASRGLFQMMRVSSVPVFLSNGTGRAFHDDTDPEVGARYLEAFRRLCHRGIVVPADDDLFQLTGTGFDEARRLASSNKKGEDCQRRLSAWILLVSAW